MPYARRRAGNKRKLYKPRKKSTKTYRKNNKRVYKGPSSGGIKPDPFPRVLYTTAHFGENYPFTCPTGGTSVARSYRMNSIYQCAFTSPFQTVTGWSQLSTLYDQYIVMGAKVQLTFSDPTADGIKVGYSLRLGSNAPTVALSVNQLTQYSNLRMATLNNTGSQTKTFNFFVRPWDLCGVNRLEYMANTSRYSSAMSANPAYPAYIDVFACNIDASDASAMVSYTIKVTYYVKCFDRNQLNPSSAP